jgi:hypothetical protein
MNEQPTKHVVYGSLAVAALVIVGFLTSWQPVPLIVVGAVLLIASFLLPKTEPSSTPGTAVQQIGGGEREMMKLPDSWDKQQIIRGVGRYLADTNLLVKYVDAVVTRFITGQDTRTMQSRIAFLEQLNAHTALSNKQAELLRERYKWQRSLRDGRAEMEEDLEDMKVQIKIQEAKNQMAGIMVDQELIELQKKANRLEVEIEIARKKKTIADINKPDPPTPAAPPTAAEITARKRAGLQASEKRIREEIEQTKNDLTLDDELKQRKLNGLYEKLTEIHDALIALL